MLINHNGKKMKMNIYICIYIKVNHFAVYQKQIDYTSIKKNNIPPIYTIVPGSFH